MDKQEIKRLSEVPCTVTYHLAAMRKLMRQRDALAALVREARDQGKNNTFFDRANKLLDSIEK